MPKKSVSTNSPQGFASLLLVLALATALIAGAVVYSNKDNIQRTLTGNNNLLGTSVAEFTLNSTSDYANQDGTSISLGSSDLWLGNGASKTTSYLGMRFTGSSIPAGATVTAAALEFTSEKDQWNQVKTNIYVEKNLASQTYSTSSQPSARTLTTAFSKYNANVKWVANQKYILDVSLPVQELQNQFKTDIPVVNLIVKGTGSAFGRKFVLAGTNGPKLRITYSTLSPTPTPVITPSPTPTSTPTPTPTATPTPTPTPTSTPIVTNTMTPTPTPTPTNGDVPGGSTGISWVDNAPLAASFGVWDPANATYTAAGPQKYPTCTKAFHDSFFVIGSDGKKYPTWHPVVAVDPSTGIKCSFGHDHGRQPSFSALWSQIQNNNYYDANHNGVMDPDEQRFAGLPFGFANEQLDAYWSSKGIASMRHEDHVGHKVDYINGEGDTPDKYFGTSLSGGVTIPWNDPTGAVKWLDTGAKCYFLEKVHQGVSTKDAFTNNLHEVQYYMSCTGPTSAQDMKMNVLEMIPFGAPGEFTNLCDAIGDRTTPVVLGTDSMNQYWPGTRGAGFRNIIQRNCVDKYFLVPSGTFSMNMYEAWSGIVHVAQGTRTITSGGNLLFDVEDANRYYYPGQPNNVGYSMDLCYEKLADGSQAHAGVCDQATNYGQITGIKWNDTRSAFRGLHRGMYMQPPVLANSGGPTSWYTDPFGNNASTSYFVGSIKQNLTSKNVDFNDSSRNLFTNPRVTDKFYDDGEGTVHAPN